MNNKLLRTELYWFLITAAIGLIMYIADGGTHYQVIGVIFLFVYSLVFNLLFLAGRFIYVQVKRKGN